MDESCLRRENYIINGMKARKGQNIKENKNETPSPTYLSLPIGYVDVPRLVRRNDYLHSIGRLQANS
jgi:hypothetical protein